MPSIGPISNQSQDTSLLYLQRDFHMLQRGHRRYSGEREYELRNGLSGTKVTIAILSIASELPRGQPTSGFHGACSSRTGQGSKGWRGASNSLRHQHIMSSRYLKIFLKESILLKEMYETSIHFSARKRWVNMIIGKIWIKWASREDHTVTGTFDNTRCFSK